jgi:hypothetical protein
MSLNYLFSIFDELFNLFYLMLGFSSIYRLKCCKTDKKSLKPDPLLIFSKI